MNDNDNDDDDADDDDDNDDDDNENDNDKNTFFSYDICLLYLGHTYQETSFSWSVIMLMKQ